MNSDIYNNIIIIDAALTCAVCVVSSQLINHFNDASKSSLSFSTAKAGERTNERNCSKSHAE